ncbi:hypothetical protein PYCC9005_002785 [Savitreella phatthalungensis]
MTHHSHQHDHTTTSHTGGKESIGDKLKHAVGLETSTDKEAHAAARANRADAVPSAAYGTGSGSGAGPRAGEPGANAVANESHNAGLYHHGAEHGTHATHGTHGTHVAGVTPAAGVPSHQVGYATGLGGTTGAGGLAGSTAVPATTSSHTATTGIGAGSAAPIAHSGGLTEGTQAVGGHKTTGDKVKDAVMGGNHVHDATGHSANLQSTHQHNTTTGTHPRVD